MGMGGGGGGGGGSNYEEVPEFMEHYYGSLFKSCFEKQIPKKLK